MGNIVCCKCSVSRINLEDLYFFKYIFCHLKLEIVLAISASNEWETKQTIQQDKR